MSFAAGIGMVDSLSSALDRARGSARVPGVEQVYSLVRDLARAVELASRLEEAAGGGGPAVRRVCNWYLVRSGSVVALTRSKPVITLTYDARSNSIYVAGRPSISIRVGSDWVELKWGSSVFKVALGELEEGVDQVLPLLRRVASLVARLLSDLTSCAKASRIRV